MLWHSGEPLIAGVTYYEDIFGFISEVAAAAGVAVQHSIQTNGTLIDGHWCAMFQKYDVRVGVSIDGPEWLHDQNRQTRRGQGTFDFAMKGVRQLQESNVPFGTITVLTRESLQHPTELFNFFSANSLRDLAFSIEESDGVHHSDSISDPLYLPDFDKFMRAFWNLCLSSGAAWKIREFDDALRRVLSPEEIPFRNYQVVPLGFLMIGADESITTFSPELLGLRHPKYQDFAIGKIGDGGPKEWLENTSYLRMAKDIALGVQRCRDTCGYFSVCGGGAPANKLGEHGTFDATRTVYCQAKTAVIDLVLEALEQSSAAIADAHG
jgi:uncharacterized protein